MVVSGVRFAFEPYAAKGVKTRALVDLVIDGCLRIRGAKVLEPEPGVLTFVFPARRTGKGWVDVVSCMNWRDKQEIEKIVLAAYQKERAST